MLERHFSGWRPRSIVGWALAAVALVVGLFLALLLTLVYRAPCLMARGDCSATQRHAAHLLALVDAVGQSRGSAVATTGPGEVVVRGTAFRPLGDRDHEGPFLARTGPSARLEDATLTGLEDAIDLPMSMFAPTREGGVLFGGRSFEEGSNPFYGGMTDGAVTKYTESGTEWTCRLGTAWNDRVVDVQPDGRGGAYALGATERDDDLGSDETYPFLVRCDASGEVLWHRPLASISGRDASMAVGPTAIYVALQTFKGVGVSAESRLAKFDRHGRRVWTRSMGDNSPEDIAAEAGCVYVAGSTREPLGHRSLPAHHYGYVTAYASNGRRRWDRYTGGAGVSEVDAIATDADCSVYAAGWARRSTDSEGARGMDGFAVKLGADGDRHWRRFFGQAYDDVVRDVAVGRRVYLVGRISSPVGAPIFDDGTTNGFVAALDRRTGRTHHAEEF